LDKRNKTGLIALGLFTLLCYLTVALFHSSLVYAYSGTSNITAATVNDARVDPSASVSWTVGPILNGTVNPIQNGWGMDFDGNGDRINCGNGASLNLNTTFTIEAWINTQTTAYRGGIIMKDLSYRFSVAWGALRFTLWDIGGGNVAYNSDPITANQNMHVAVTYDGANLRFYVNGTAHGVHVVNDFLKVSANPTYIGDGFNDFNGTIDEARIYNRSIGTGEIAYSYEHKVPLNQNGLVLWVDFDQNVQDQSGNGNNGVVNGDPVYVRGIRGKAALTFDGTGDYVQVSTDASLNIPVNQTIEFWLKTPELPAAGKFFSTVFKTTSYALRITEVGRIGYFVWGKSEANSATGPITVDMPHFITWTYDGVSHIITVDNNVVLNNPVVETFPIPNTDLFFGDDGIGGAYVFTNATLFDEVRVYNRTITTTEKTQHYNGIYNDESGLVLYLDFDGNVNDHSGEGNNGAVNGDPEYSDGWANCPVSTSYNGTGGTTVSLVNCTTGLCTIPDTAPATPANYTVTATVPAASENATYLGFIVDRYDVTLAVVDGTVSAGYPAILYATGESYLGDHSLTSGDTVTIDTEAYTWTSILTRFQRSVTQTTIGTRTYGSSITGHEATYNITNFTVNTIHVTWIDGIKYALTNGLIVQAIWLILGASIGTEIAAALIALGVMIPTYIMTDRIEYSAGLWILLGGVLEAQLPGQVLGLGKVLFILGMAVFFWRLFIGGGRQHG